MNAGEMLMVFWPLVCGLTFALTVPVVRRRQTKEPNWDPRVYVATVFGGVFGGVVAGVWRWGWSEER